MLFRPVDGGDGRHFRHQDSSHLEQGRQDVRVEHFVHVEQRVDEL